MYLRVGHSWEYKSYLILNVCQFFEQVLSFPVHSMGWIELEESQVAPHNMSDTISDCISTLAQKRKDLWQTGETWGEVNAVFIICLFIYLFIYLISTQLHLSLDLSYLSCFIYGKKSFF